MPINIQYCTKVFTGTAYQQCVPLTLAWSAGSSQWYANWSARNQPTWWRRRGFVGAAAWVADADAVSNVNNRRSMSGRAGLPASGLRCSVESRRSRSTTSLLPPAKKHEDGEGWKRGTEPSTTCCMCSVDITSATLWSATTRHVLTLLRAGQMLLPVYEES